MQKGAAGVAADVLRTEVPSAGRPGAADLLRASMTAMRTSSWRSS